MKVYLANSLGFSPAFKQVLDLMVVRLEAEGFIVYEPFRRNNSLPLDEIAAANVADIKVCDAVVAIIHDAGPDFDAGIAWELGFSAGCGKPNIIVRLRHIEAADLNLQAIYGAKVCSSIEEAITLLRTL